MAAGTKATELRQLNNEDLVGKLREAKEELFNLRFRRRPDSSRTTAG
jgi:large subunit ribosomal protein L29